MSLIRKVLGRNKYLVLAAAEKLDEIPEFIHITPRVYSITTSSRVNAIEKVAKKNYKLNEIVYYRFKVFTEDEYTEIAKESIVRAAITNPI